MIFHYVVAGMAALFALFPIFHLLFGLFIVSRVESKPATAGRFD